MTEEDLHRGKLLGGAIKVTKKSLKSLKEFLAKEQRARRDNFLHQDPYSLCISEHKDHSGFSMDLTGYRGNRDLLKGIEALLEKQLNAYEKQFSEI